MDGKFRLHIILEGNEEETFFTYLSSYFALDNIELTYKNAGGAQNIPIYYQDAYARDYDLVVCIYDGDYKTNDSTSIFSDVKEKLIEVLGDETLVDAISFVSNPNILIWYLIGFDNYKNINQISSCKKDNTLLLNKYFPEIGKSKKDNGKCAKNYDASKWQLECMSYGMQNNPLFIQNLKENSKYIPITLDDTRASSNLRELLISLINNDMEYLNNLKNKIKNN